MPKPTQDDLTRAFLALLRERDRGLLTDDDYAYRLALLEHDRDQLQAQEDKDA